MRAGFPQDRDALVAAERAGERFEYLLFYGHEPRADGALCDGVFSQWWRWDFVVAGVRYPTAEHWMMASKARLFRDEAALEQILAAESPRQAKALGRTVRNFNEARWKQHRVALVTEGNVHKFGSDPTLRAYLLDTGDTVLVEAAPRDAIWGIGLAKSNPAARDPARWRGLNLLGFALCQARATLRARG